MAVYKRDIVDINLETGNIHRSWLKHSIGYKDQKADHFGVRTYRDGTPVDLTGVSVQGVFLPPQGDPIAITSGNIVSGNVAEVVLPQACYNYDGQFTLAIKLVDSNNNVTGTVRIVDGMVDNTHASGTVAPTSAVPTYQEILSTYNAMIAATASANGAIAATYSSSSTYAVGDYCIHDGGLYRCTTAITTGEAWTAGHWTAAKLGPDLSDVKSAIDVTDGPVSTLLPFSSFYPLKNGYAINNSNGSESAASYFSCTDYIDISNSTSIIYSIIQVTVTTVPTHGMAFYNASKQYISGYRSDYSKPSRGVALQTLTVPSTAKYARFTYWSNSIIAEESFDRFVLYDGYLYKNNLKNDFDSMKNDIYDDVITQSKPYSLTDGFYIYYDTGDRVASSSFSHTDYIDISDIEKIRYKRLIVNSVAPAHGMAFYNSSKEYISGIASLPGSSAGYTYYNADVPEGAVYARFTWRTNEVAEQNNMGKFFVCDASIYSESLVGRVDELEKKPSGVNVAAVHEVPQSEGVQNAILTAHQFTDILWTPLADMPGIYRDPATQAISYKTHKKGCRQKGIPYGSGLPFNQQVNGSIAFDAFATAVKTAGSVLYTNSMYDDNKMASYYGVACSKMVQACWGAPQIYDSQNIFNMPGLVKIADPGQYTVDDIQLGDGVLNPLVHCTICTDILKDTKGNVVGIEISEAVMPTCRRLVWSVNEFYEHFATYGLYRYSLIGNAKYNKARYIDLDDGYEGVNDIPIGIKRGSFINMPYTSSWKAFVDNTKWTTLHDIVNGVEQTSSISSNDIYLPKDRLGYHEIYPTDANGNRGNSSFYFVYSITASATVDSEIATISYAVTENMKPIAIRFGSYFYELVEGDVGTGTVEVEVPSGSTSCTVLFINDYGMVFSNSIPLT